MAYRALCHRLGGVDCVLHSRSNHRSPQLPGWCRAQEHLRLAGMRKERLMITPRYGIEIKLPHTYYYNDNGEWVREDYEFEAALPGHRYYFLRNARRDLSKFCTVSAGERYRIIDFKTYNVVV